MILELCTFEACSDDVVFCCIDVQRTLLGINYVYCEIRFRLMTYVTICKFCSPFFPPNDWYTWPVEWIITHFPVCPKNRKNIFHFPAIAWSFPIWKSLPVDSVWFQAPSGWMTRRCEKSVLEHEVWNHWFYFFIFD